MDALSEYMVDWDELEKKIDGYGLQAKGRLMGQAYDLLSSKLLKEIQQAIDAAKPSTLIFANLEKIGSSKYSEYAFPIYSVIVDLIDVNIKQGRTVTGKIMSPTRLPPNLVSRLSKKLT